MELSQFVKFFPLRATKLAWFFGAGSSISAGVRSAYDLTWDFKKTCYCAEQSYPMHLYQLSDPGIKEQIQNYFDAKGTCPLLDSNEEYSFYFERAYPSAVDRSEYIAKETRGMQLTYGHKVIGSLIKSKQIPLIFTTNFDKAFENIAKSQFDKLEDWFCSDLDNAEVGIKYFQSNKTPLIVKLHGDYFSQNIKNTSFELQKQDERLRNILALTIETFGLCVMGYSGRDASIMEILIEAANKPMTYPQGLFWFVRAGTDPLPDVKKLIEVAKNNGKQAAIIEIDTFDTAWENIVKGFGDLPEVEWKKLKESYPRLVNSILPKTGKNYPLLRLNAIPIIKFPSLARIYRCEVGNTKEVKNAINDFGSSIIATRKKDGVVGFGKDDEFLQVFSKYGSYEIDFFQIRDYHMFDDDSSLKGLLVNALLLGLTREAPLKFVKRREKYMLFPDPKMIDDVRFGSLRKVVGNIKGNVPRTKLTWIIALEINIQSILSTPLMILSPTVIATKSSEKLEGSLVAPFVKEFTARWYNQKFTEILNAWLDIIFERNRSITISAFDPSMNGINAKFEIGRTTAFSQTNQN